jgi:hypothetical protein
MKAFISYATEEKHWGAQAKEVLTELGFTPFLAHDDIAVSQQWRNRIAEELNEATVFVALLSKAFRASDWCSQETGWIAGRPSILVVPLSIDGTNPYGFISHIQARRIQSDSDLNTALTEVLLREMPRTAIPRAIQRVAGARSFREAEANLKPLVPHFASFTDSEAGSLVEAASRNGQVWHAGLCRVDYLPLFLRLNRQRISPDQFNKLATKIEYDGNGA